MGTAGRPLCLGSGPVSAAPELRAAVAGNRPVREASGWEGPGREGSQGWRGRRRERGACEEGPGLRGSELVWLETRKSELGLKGDRAGVSLRLPFPFRPRPRGDPREGPPSRDLFICLLKAA